MILRADLRKRPEPGVQAPDPNWDVIVVQAADYDTAKAELDSRVPEGWQIMSVRTSED